ncbi:MAG: GNAT family N-acetyltransferase [Pseudomonadota bacterium]
MERALTTERLHLKAIDPADAEVVAPHCAEPAIYRMLTKMPPNQSVADTRAFLEATAMDRDAHGYTIWAGEEFAGIVSLTRQSHGFYLLGYWSVVSAWGKGYMTEAAGALRVAFVEETGIGILQSGYFSDNPASGRVLRKLGFLPCGRQSVYSLGRDCFVDHQDMVWVS